MLKRTMGIETEYGLLLKRSDGKFCKKQLNEKFLLHPWRTGKKEFDGLFLFKDPHDYHTGLWLGSNGGRVYRDNVLGGDEVDHVEYSSAECISGKDVSLYNAAGDLFMQKVRASFLDSRTFKKLACKKHRHADVLLSKNNSDFVRPTNSPKITVNFYGSHENYITYKRFFKTDADVEFSEKIAPFFVSRVILHGSGRKQLYTRLHPVYGDSNMSQYSTWLRFDSTHLMLRILEELKNVRLPKLINPLADLHLFAQDTSLQATAATEQHGRITAIELQKHYIDLALRLKLSPYEKEFIAYWASVLRRLEEDPMNLCRELDWAIKKNFLQSSMARRGYDLQNKKARIIDVTYSELSPGGIYYRLEGSGNIDTLFAKSEIESALRTPPKETRARLRSDYVVAVRKRFGKQYTDEYGNVRWESVHTLPEFELNNPFASTSKKLQRFLESKKFLNPAT
ncbi:MAG: proteasome accessory factor PafA2 family protein [Candidatus Sungbacteria bacterium]|nr:proteasome accessory factor PafA2 family protein [Candidatus Sungbacteria bacterium]